VSFTATTLCVASQRVFIFVSVYFVTDSVRKLLDTPSYVSTAEVNKLCHQIYLFPSDNHQTKKFDTTILEFRDQIIHVSSVLQSMRVQSLYLRRLYGTRVRM
jgi:hypothetical protein